MRAALIFFVLVLLLLETVPVRAASFGLSQSGNDWTVNLTTEPGEVLSMFHVDLNFDPLSLRFISGDYGTDLGPLLPFYYDEPYVFGANQSAVHFQRWSPSAFPVASPGTFRIANAHFESLTGGAPSAVTIGSAYVNGPIWVPEPGAGWLALAGLIGLRMRLRQWMTSSLESTKRRETASGD